MAKSRLQAYYGGGSGVGMESSAIEDGVEIHYNDENGEYKIDRIEGDSSSALIDNLMDGVNKITDDDDCTLLYLAVAGDGENDDDD